jgi:hypothetical protein
MSILGSKRKMEPARSINTYYFQQLYEYVGKNIVLDYGIQQPFI